MSDVLTIPGVATVHPRSSWQDPKYPITGPQVVWSKISTGVAHYPAADDLIDGDPGEHAEDLPAYFRAMQRSYVLNRGYSLGYWWGVDWLGGAWQIRGWDLQSAANKGDSRKTGVANVNRFTGPVLFLVDGQDDLTEEAAATGRAIYAEMGRRAGRPIGRPVPHSDLDFTSCCGDGIRRRIAAGGLDPTATPPQPPPPPRPTIPGVPDVFHAITPIRNSDTRALAGSGIGPGDATFGLNPAIPADAVAVAMNVVAISTTAPGFVTVWPGGARPDTSVVNFTGDGRACNGSLIVGVADQAFKIYTSAKAHLIVDITGYWTK